MTAATYHNRTLIAKVEEIRYVLIRFHHTVANSLFIRPF
jgi:hypothetical protein